MADPFEDAEPAAPKRFSPPLDFRTFLEMQRYDRYGDFLPFEDEYEPEYPGNLDEYKEPNHDGF